QVAEDDVLHSVPNERLSLRLDLHRLLAVEQVQDDRDIVSTEAPERVLVLADLAQVQPLRIEVVQIAERACIEDLLQLPYPRVVEPDPSHRPGPAGVSAGARVHALPSLLAPPYPTGGRSAPGGPLVERLHDSATGCSATVEVGVAGRP